MIDSAQGSDEFQAGIAREECLRGKRHREPSNTYGGD
jgi:hypothetical protein